MVMFTVVDELPKSSFQVSAKLILLGNECELMSFWMVEKLIKIFGKTAQNTLENVELKL